MKKPLAVPLETRRLILRRFHSADSGDCFSFLSDAETCRNNGFLPFDAMDEEYGLLMERFAAQTGRCMVVCRETNRVIGTIVLFPAEEGAAVELGFTISPAHRRQGYCTEALDRLMDCCRQVGVRRFIADTLPDNAAAQAVLTGLGFRQAGTVSIDCDLAQGQRMLRCLRDEAAHIR
ncbi:MAG: GNAT family N-acetyltransferase [Clostridiales bacterium]|nr:GNAT family N-acetyltransferase [Clostridiales bacterium]